MTYSSYNNSLEIYLLENIKKLVTKEEQLISNLISSVKDQKFKQSIEITDFLSKNSQSIYNLSKDLAEHASIEFIMLNKEFLTDINNCKQAIKYSIQYDRKLSIKEVNQIKSFCFDIKPQLK